MAQPIYAIGDIHGQIDMLEEALDLIAADGGADARIIFLGDLCDRGPDSRAVIERVRSGIEDQGRNWACVLGNHDLMFRTFVETGADGPPRLHAKGLTWTNPRLGGLTTLASYGIDTEDAPTAEMQKAAAQAVDPAHLRFIDSLPLYLSEGDCLFVHAGIRPHVPLSDQVEDDLVWIREGWLDFDGALPWLVVHGHTALDIAQHHGNRVNLDSGAGYGRPLTAAVFEGDKVWTLSAHGRARLLPSG
ncbi:metallophosphoesterase family protein [Pseudaestuariivita atlantica]|uniref:Serine/threonine protein phosphatase n=1 Tax=Pseudaestuariivita atlantica TaxID=1317121 RepID=A0A0L1JPY8_9RHOB|nr:metallophosphoesterase family protein [Pseudaestuariivita atlantica]KNG93835.1 serine/threonine protein phosphatase [Pseudaestuariivita atlantica]